MTTPDFDHIEAEAVKQGGRAAYAYLDYVNKENVFELTEEEAVEFFERVVDGFGAHMRVKLIAKKGEKNGR